MTLRSHDTLLKRMTSVGQRRFHRKGISVSPLISLKISPDPENSARTLETLGMRAYGTLLYCQLALSPRRGNARVKMESKVWRVLRHDNTKQTRYMGSQPHHFDQQGRLIGHSR